MNDVQIRALPTYRSEWALGIISALLGLGGLSVLLFAPLARDATTGVTRHSSLWSSGFVAAAWPLFAPIVLAYIAIPIGTVMRTQLQLPAGSWIRWSGVAVTVIVALLISILGASFGSVASELELMFLFVPGAALGFVTAILGRDSSRFVGRV